MSQGLLPNDIILALEYAEKNGVPAIRIKWDKLNKNKAKTVSYWPIVILKIEAGQPKKLPGTTELEYVPLKIRHFRHKTVYGCSKKEPSTQVKTQGVTFSRTSTYINKERNDKGDIIETVQNYGDAKIRLGRLINAMVKDYLLKELPDHVSAKKNFPVTTGCKFTWNEKVKVGKVEREVERITPEDEITVAVEVPFKRAESGNLEIGKGLPSEINIADMRRSEVRNGKTVFLPAEVTNNAGGKVKVNYDNIHLFLNHGCEVTGPEEYDSLMESKQGFGVSRKFGEIVAIPGKGRTDYNMASSLDPSLLGEIEGATNEQQEEPPAPIIKAKPTGTKPSAPTLPVDPETVEDEPPAPVKPAPKQKPKTEEAEPEIPVLKSKAPIKSSPKQKPAPAPLDDGEVIDDF